MTDSGTMSQRTSPARLTRRHAIGGAVGAGLGVPLLSACGGESAVEEPAAGAAGVTTGEVPVGGGVIDADANIVVTQPTEGEFKVFTATCTHQGCQVSKVLGDSIDCTCHGSRFSIADGSVVQGPAESGLQPVEFTVESGEIVIS